MKKYHPYYLAILFLFIASNYCISQIKESEDTAVLNKYLREANRILYANIDSSYVWADKAMKLSIKINSERHISLANQLIGKFFLLKENFSEATKHYLEALQIEEKRKDEKRIASLYDDLGYIYRQLENFNKSLDYYSKALAINEKYKDTLNIAMALSHIGALHSSREFCGPRNAQQKREDCTTAIYYIEKSLKLNEKIKNEEGIISCYLNLSSVYNKSDKSDKAIPYLLKTIAYYRQRNNGDGLTNAYYILGTAYYKLGKYAKSVESYNTSLKEAQARNITDGIQFLYELMAQSYDAAHDYKNAKDYYVKYMILRDSIYNAEKSKQVFELETKYQTEKKEKEIAQLTAQKKQRTLLIYSLLGFIVLVIIITFFIIRNIYQKRIITEQKLQHLEKERQLLATQSVLQGEEAERGRLAKDLHDGLGGLLSGVKLSLTGLKVNYALSDENVKKFDHTLDLLDSSIKEMRRISHNMMPEALIKFGIKDALADFCSNLEKQIKINFNAYGTEKRINQDIEISLYRIAQELINNAIKHSQANELIVQLIVEDSRVNLTVQDNGQGFDTSILSTSKGAGIANIRSRVEAFNGRIDIYSEPGKGAEFIVEFKV